MGILLKIFSGPHLGAEIPLAPGTTTLGSSRSCDLVIQDSSVAERHLCIIVPDSPDRIDEIAIKTIDAPVTLINQQQDVYTRATPDSGAAPGVDQKIDRAQQPGEQRVEGEASWKPLTPLMLGTTCLAWKLEDETWGDFIPSTAFSSKSFIREKQGSIPGRDAEKDQDAGQQTAPAQKVILPPLFVKILKYAGVLFLFLLIFGPCIGTNDTKLAGDMKHVLKKQGFEYLTVTQTNIGVTVSGIVDTQEERGRLWKISGGMDYPVFVDIRVNEERAFAVKVALSVRGLFPEVELDEKNILVKGYMRDKLIEGASKIWIRNDIFEVDKIDSAMVYAFQVWPVLKDRLIKHRLENLVTIRFHPGLVQVEGELDFDQRQTLETVKGEVCDRLSSPIAFWDTLTAPGFSSEWNSSLNSGMRSKFSPDPALAQLFLDSQSAKGVPAFVASTPGLRATKDQDTGIKPLPFQPPTSSPGTQVSLSGSPYTKEKLDEILKDAKWIKDSKGNQLAVIQDKDGKMLGALIPDGQGDFQRTPSGEPLLLPVMRDKDGKLVRDKKGNLIFAEPLRDEKGDLLLKDKTVAARDELGRLLVDEQGRPVMGEVLRNADGTVQRDKQGRILVRDEKGEIVPTKPIPQGAARDELGRLLVDEQGRPVMGEVLRNADGTIQSDNQGRILVRNEKGEVLPTKPIPSGAAKDELGRLLIDEQGRPVFPETQMPIMTGPVLDGEGNVVYDREGKPIMGRVAFDRNGKIITDADGNPVVLGVALDEKGKPLKDSDGRVIPLTIARDAENRVVRDKDGNPLLVPALLDRDGRILRNEKGNPVAPRVITDADGKAVFDRQGNLILDQDANNILLSPDGDDNNVGSQPGDVPPGSQGSDNSFGAGDTQTGSQTPSDKNVFGSGTVVADKLNQEKEIDPLGGLSIVSITLKPIPFVSMKDGQKFFTGGKLPGGYVIKSIATDRLVLERQGKTKILKMRHD
ncbi:MAG: type III secretion system inner membrane ring subunit SctD [Desulfobacterium sp.]|jgi:type III secretion protein D|nr:type III secretion system inner membrane ring subunit SctD [Desulfobacterium sp.]